MSKRTKRAKPRKKRKTRKKPRALSGQPHDHHFGSVFKDPKDAASVMRQSLPVWLTMHVDFSTLKPLASRWLDEELDEARGDLFYSVQLANREAFCFVLWEHWSSPEPKVFLRLLKYMAFAWAEWWNANPKAKKLPVIIPLVLYHGKAPWPAPQWLAELLNIPPELDSEIRIFVPNFTYVLEDLSERSDEELISLELTAVAQVALRLFKHIWDEDLGELLPSIFLQTSGFWATREGLQKLREMLNYLARASRRVTQAHAEALARQLGPEAEKIVSTLAEQWEQKGIEKGIEEGIEKGIEKGRIERSVQAIFDVFEARRIPVALNIRQRIRECTDADLLEKWLRRSAVAESAGEIFDV